MHAFTVQRTVQSARAMLDRLVKGMFAPNEVPPGFYSEISREMMLRPVQLRANARTPPS